MRRLRLSEALGLVRDHPVWLGPVPETPPTTALLLEEAPKVREERRSELVTAQRGLNTAEGHTAGRRGGGRGLAQGWCPRRTVSQGCGGATGPSSPGNLSGQGRRRFPWSAGLHTRGRTPFSAGERGFVTLPALGTLAARPPNKTRPAAPARRWLSPWERHDAFPGPPPHTDTTQDPDPWPSS